MGEKISDKKYMLLLRYGYILFFIFSFGQAYKAVTFLQIVLFLFFIINNQLRYFIFPNKNAYKLPSLIIEIIICCNLYSIGGSYAVLIFIPALLDIIYIFKPSYSFIYMIGISLLIILQGKSDLLIIWIISSFTIFILLYKTKEVEIRKTTAQELYDKLREKDEELKKANQELETYANTIEEITVLRERNRISREIHDNVGHALSTIIIQLGAIEKVCKTNQEEAAKMAINLATFAKESMERVRAEVRDMKPRELEEYEGIIAISEMIKNFEKLTGVNVNLRVSDKVWKLNSDQTMVMYRIMQEFLSNSIKHGKATEVKIFINFLDFGLRVHLKNNGIGCVKIVEGVGLTGIKERVAVWGGSVEYFSKEGQGFELIITMDKVKLSLDGV